MSTALRGSTLARHGLFFLGLAVVLLLLTSFVFDPYTNYNVTEVAIYAISAAGLTVLTGVNGQISLGHGALMMIGAYTTSVLLTWHADLPLILILVASIATTAIAGAIVGIAGARLRGPYLAGATLALAVALPQVPSHFATIFGGNQGLSIRGARTARTARSSGREFLRAAVVGMDRARRRRDHVLPAGEPGARIHRHAVSNRPRQRGRRPARWHRCRPNPGAGIRDQRGVRRAGGIAVRLLGHRHIAERLHAQPVSLSLLTAIVIGGLGSLSGAVLGSFILVYLPVWTGGLTTSLNLPSNVANNVPLAIYGIVLIVAILAFPRGVAGGVAQIIHGLRRMLRSNRRTAGLPAAPVAPSQ